MPSSVTLDPVQRASLDRLVADGRFGSTEEAVAAGVALLLRREHDLASLHGTWRDGVESGDYEPLDTVLDELGERYAAWQKPEV